jgi:hypothetical protein
LAYHSEGGTPVAGPANRPRAGELEQRLRLGIRAIRRAMGHFDRGIDNLETADADLSDVLKVVRLQAVGTHASADAARHVFDALRKLRQVQEARRRDELVGVHSIAFQRNQRGGAIAMIDGKRLDLTRSPRLVGLLSVLAEHSVRSADFLPFDQLDALVEKATGKPLTPRERTQLLYRLRRRFIEIQLDPDLIQTGKNGHERSGRHGIRLVRRAVP